MRGADDDANRIADSEARKRAPLSDKNEQAHRCAFLTAACGSVVISKRVQKKKEKRRFKKDNKEKPK